MKRRAFLRQAAGGVLAGAVAAPALAQTGSPVRWRLATSWPKSLDAMHGAADEMGRRVTQLSEKKFEIQSFAGGEIVPPLQVLDAVQNGTIECGHTLTSFYIGKNPAYAFDSGLAFGLNNRQQNAWMYHGGGLELHRGTCSGRSASIRSRAAMSASRWAASTARRSTRSTTSRGSSSASAGSAA